jgi:predicted metal-binding membrane protein
LSLHGREMRSATEPRGSGTRSLREIAPLWTLLALVGGVAWVVTVGQARDMGAGPGTMDMAFPVFVGMWVAMMAAMMLPAVGRVAAGGAILVDRPQAARRIPGVLAFGAGFLLPWAAYGVLAFLALVGTGRLVETSPDAAKWLGVGILAVAGLYQFTPWKLRALEHCRMLHLGRRTGTAGDLGAGVRDGAICVGCCWALMTILIAVGVMNIVAMAGLAVVIFSEKVLPRPRVIAGLAGAVFLVLAVVAAFHPSILSGLWMSEMTMEMGGM